MIRLATLAFVLASTFCAVAHAGGGKLGFTVDFKADRTTLDAALKRVAVVDVAAGSAAERAGMQVGDVLEALEGKPLAGSSARNFFSTLGGLDRGQRVTLTVRRDDAPITMTLVAE
ncbi:PDZ domain-containing protein [Dokdonella sp. MW10]|uniref:PDZ domain-containing protein n=1 Tax=Dokdonella sp. MW10 TaxID=2992926 RepID=UPI003F7FF4D7